MNGESGLFVSMRSKAIVIGVLEFAFAIPLAMSAEARAGAGVEVALKNRQEIGKQNGAT